MPRAGDSVGQRAVFLDRDGVLIEEQRLLTEPKNVRLTAGAPAAVLDLQRHGIAVVVVTNQTVVARGMCTEAEVHAVHGRVDELLIAGGAQPILAWYACFHHPRATLEQYRSDCTCRKPLPGLLLRASAEHALDLDLSVMVGDRLSDVVAGHRAGCTTVLLETGAHLDPLIESSHHDVTVRPDAVCTDLPAAVAWILRSAR